MLRESGKLKNYESVLEFMPSGVILIEASDGKFLFINKRARFLLGPENIGVDLSEFSARFKAFTFEGEPYPLENLPAFITLRSGREVRNQEMLIERPDGVRFPLVISSSPLFSTDSKMSLVILHLEDVTEHKRVEDILRIHARLLENMSDAVIAAGIDWRIVVWNAAAEKIFGWKAEEVMGKNVDDILSPGTTVTARKKAAKYLLAKEKLEYERHCQDRFGRLLITYDRITVIKNDQGQVIGIQGVICDITERKKAEEALARAKDELEIRVKERTADLRRSEEKYRLLVENAHEAVMVFQNLRVKFSNTRATALMGYSQEEFNNKPIANFVYSEDLDLVKDRHCRRIQGEDVPKSYEFRIVDSAGNIKWVLLNAVLINWEGAPAVLGLMTDITDRKNMEDELREYARRITQVQEEERKRIAFELHDDTAQYLSILKLQLDSLINSGKIQNEAVLEKLRYLEKDAGRAVDDVRRYSHELRPGILEHLGLQAALEQIAEDINKLGQFKVEVVVEGDEPLLSEDIKLGFFRIAQEAMNNCRKHSGADRAIISLKYELHDLTMEIKDEGIGFDAQESFILSKEKGSLGMMSMKERADLINADLKIKSASGKGTQVILKARV